ncbi:hypothetical protein BHE74_00017294, partial [Ensete ventricosum]
RIFLCVFLKETDEEEKKAEAMDAKSVSPAGDCAFSAGGYLPADRLFWFSSYLPSPDSGRSPSFGLLLALFRWFCGRNRKADRQFWLTQTSYFGFSLELAEGTREVLTPILSSLFHRYQRVSPDVLPLGNGRKPILRTNKEDDADHSSRNANHSPSEGKATRARSVSVSAGPCRDHQFPRIPVPADSPTSAAATHSVRQPPPSTSPKSQIRQHHDAVNGVGGDVVLQWGHNKRSRGPRASGDETSAHLRQLLKIPRRSPALSSSAMPPPPCGGWCARAGHLTTSIPVRDAKKYAFSLSPSFSFPIPCCCCHVPTAPRVTADAPVNPSGPKQPPPDQEPAPVAIAEKLSLDRLEWPKIYLSLSRKEKEDDFLAMKGTKLPQRPKKRAKNIDRTLQVSIPSTAFVSFFRVVAALIAGLAFFHLLLPHRDLLPSVLPTIINCCCIVQRRRGLKGMESVDSDSE